MEKTAKELRSEQERALQLYVNHLNGTAEELQALMNEERILDANEALQLGLIKEIRQLNQESKQVPESGDINSLFIQFKMSYNMEEKDKEKLSGLSNKVETLWNKLFPTVKNVMVQDTNGVEINFPDVETEEQIAVGDAATVDGTAANETYILGDGSSYVFADGLLTEIIPAEAEAEANEEMEALKTENETQANEIANLQNKLNEVTADRDSIKNEFDTSKTEMETIKNEFDLFKNKFSDEKPKPNTPETPKKDGERTKFSYKKN